MPDEKKTQSDVEAEDKQERQRLFDESLALAKAKRELRIANLNAENNRPAENFFRSLDSTVKRNSAFIKRLRAGVSEENKAAIIKEISQLNLTKYVTEAVQAILEAKIKMSDVPAVIEVSSKLHQLYPDFSPAMVDTLVKQTLDPAVEITKRRIAFRVLIESYICGIFTDAQKIYSTLKELIVKDKDIKSTDNLSIVSMFIRYAGEEIAGIKPRLQDSIASENKPFVKDEERLLPRDKQQHFVDLLNTYYDLVCSALLRENEALKKVEEDNHHMLAHKGELTPEQKTIYENARTKFEKLFNLATTFSTYINKDFPEFPEQDKTTRIKDGPSGDTPAGQAAEAEAHPLFDDEATRAFYEDLPDIRQLVPGVLLGGSKDEKKDQEADDAADKIKLDQAERDAPREEAESAADLAAGTGKSKVDALLATLPSCCSRSLIEKWAVDFCYVNSKTNRRKLVKTLFGVNRTSLELLPHYSRLVAILFPVFKDIGNSLVSMLEEEFDQLFKAKDQIKIESKVKNIRFLGELTKFRVCPPTVVLTCLARCLDDFAHHNIDVACHLLEVCGKFLYNSKETKTRTENLLNTMMRYKEIKSLDPKYDTMVENAYYQSKPAARAAHYQAKPIPPLHQYINHLLFSELSRHSVKKVLKQLRKLPWDQPEIRDAVMKTFRKISRSKFNYIHLIASVTSGLARYHEDFGVRVVDQLLEDIRLGLSNEKDIAPQRRIMDVKFLGELYNYKMFDSAIIFDTLYSMIFYARYADPPKETIRIRLVCTLLETCAPYFDKASSRKRLNRFLVYFQRYVLGKGVVLPVDVDFALADTLEAIRPNLKWPASYQEACDAVQKLEQQLADAKTYVSLPGNERLWPITRPEGEEYEESDEDEDEAAEPGEENPEAADEADEGSADDKDGAAGDDEADGEQAEDDKADYNRGEYNRQLAQEALELDREFQRIMMDSMKQRKNETKGVKMKMMTQSIAQILKEKKPEATTGGATTTTAEEGAQQGHHDAADGGHVKFTVLMKRGTKVRDIEVPLESPLALQKVHQKKAEEEEHNEMKKKILQYGQQQQAYDDYSSSFYAGDMGRGGRGQGRGRVLRIGGQQQAPQQQQQQQQPNANASNNTSNASSGGGDSSFNRTARGGGRGPYRSLYVPPSASASTDNKQNQ